jgi:gliding motility-associated-like protein
MNWACAQQGNHLVVQGYEEILNTNVEPYAEALKKTIYYDVDLNSPQIAVSQIKSKRIEYNYYVSPGQPKYYASVNGTGSPGYQSISNGKGDLVAYAFNSILFNKNGDSIDYITQYGGYHGIACSIGNSDTFKLYYISSKTQYSANSFDKEMWYQPNRPPITNDSFYLIEATYYGDKKIKKLKILGFGQAGKAYLLESNITLFRTKSKDQKLQFVWDKHLYEINITNNYQTNHILINNYLNPKCSNLRYDWLDYEGITTPPRLVTSPSGRWTVYSWSHAYYCNNTYKKSYSKVLLIDNENAITIKELFNDSADYRIDDFTCWQHAVFTKSDSTFLLQELTLRSLGINEGSDITVKINEFQIAGKTIKSQVYDIRVDSVYTHGVRGAYSPYLRDFFLAPNGNIYVFITRVFTNSNKKLYRRFEIATLKKTATYFTIEKPIPIMEGVSVENDMILCCVYNRIFFPSTPIPYHKIDFTAKSLCNDLLHEFTNHSDTAWFDHFRWFWGDGDSSKSNKLNLKTRHRYAKPGKYEVLLKAMTSDGGWVWYSDSIEVLPEPIAKYHTSKTIGCQWIAVSFFDSSTLEKKSHTWHWDFGDGKDTNLNSPGNLMPKNKSIQHTFTTSGKFNVQLRVSDGRCTDTFSTIQNIQILPAPRPGIDIDVTKGCTPLQVQFGRKYSDPTDSTIYSFKPTLVPTNRFANARNQTTINQAGKFKLFQKLYGPSGCITKDSVDLVITPGIPNTYKPFLKRSTVLNNTTTLTEWQSVPYAKNYQVYRNGLPLDVVRDPSFTDHWGADIEQSFTYQIQAIDSCNNLAGQKSNIGRTIFLKVTEVQPATKSDFPTALLTWSPYEDWTASGGVKSYVCVGNLDIESSNWQQLSNPTETYYNDKQFIVPKKFEKCYRIKASSGDNRFVTESNIDCLGYTATLFAPSAFTPNGDGLNDAFEIFNYGFDHFTFSIYNAWGQKIYEQTNSEATWKPDVSVPEGVYMYMVKAYQKEKEYTFSSTVTLLK